MKQIKLFLDDSRSLKIRKKNSGITVEKMEGEDLINSNLRRPFNLAEASCKISKKIF